MKRKIIIGALVATLLAMYVAPAFANDTATITITMNNTATASIIVDPDAWSPAAGLNQVADSAGDHFTLTNNGNVTVNVNMKGADSDNGWTLGATPAHDQFEIQYNQTGMTTLTTSYDDCVMSSALSPEGGSNTIVFGLILHMPTSTSTALAQSTIVTIKATAN